MKILKKIEIIKILICIVITSFVGCGGGGGGGSNTTIRPTPNVPNINIPNVIDKNSGYGIKYKINNENTLNSNFSLSGDKVVGIYGEKINFSGILKIDDTRPINEENENLKTLNNFSFGIFSEDGQLNNKGEIKLSGDKVVGFFGNNSDITNNGEISSISSNKVIGIFSTGSKGITRNNGDINLIGKNEVVGLYSDNSSGVNNGTINLSSKNFTVGMIAFGKDGAVVNNNKIFINSQNKGYGMIAGNGAKAINNGMITINNKGYGMVAFNGGYALNERNAIINLGSNAFGAMIADGENSIIENRGVINIDKNNTFIKEGKELQAINGGKIINSGIINKEGNIDLNMNEGIYSIKTEIDGNYGKIQSQSLNIDGNLEINTGIVKGSYKDEYLLKNIFVADKIDIGKDLNINSDSLLYDTKLEANEEGNIDGILIRNDKELSDFVKEDLKKTANIFTKYFDEEKYISLDEYSKNIIDRIDITDKNSLEKNLSDLTPSLYVNRRYEILQLKDLFQEKRREAIEGIKDNEYNFTILEDYYKVNSKDGIEGYKNITSGFVATKSLEKNKYLSFGYSYSDVDYKGDEKGKINTIHIGMDKMFKIDENILKIGGSGEYNFHKNQREFSEIGIDSKFKSYGVSSYGEISKQYTNKIEFEPFIRFELGYYETESFEENINNFIIDIEKDNILFVKPEIGIKLNKKLEKLNLYSNIKYSYGINRGKDKVEYRYKNLNEVSNFESDYSEGKSLDIKLGTNYTNEKFDFNFNLGKSFENRDKEYIELNIGYRF